MSSSAFFSFSKAVIPNLPSSVLSLDCDLASTGEKRSLACIVQGDIYDRYVYERVCKKTNTILITFGPVGKTDEGKIHYHSLTQKFPSVIMQEIGSMWENGSLSRKESLQRSVALPRCGYEELKILVAEDNKVRSSQDVVTLQLRAGLIKQTVFLIIAYLCLSVCLSVSLANTRSTLRANPRWAKRF